MTAFSQGFNANNNAKDLMNRGKFREAVAEAQKAKAAFMEVGWKDGCIMANNMMTSAFIKLVEFDSAKIYMEESLDDMEFHTPGGITKATSFYVAANYYAAMRNLDMVKHFAEQIDLLLKEELTLMDTTGLPEFFKVGMVLSTNSGLLNEMREVIKANTNNILGATYLSTYDYGKAENLFHSASISYRNAREYLDEAGAYFNLAMIYYGNYQHDIIERDSVDFLNAQKYFHRSIETAQQSPDEKNALIGYIHFFWGKLYHLNRNYNEGQYHLELSLDLISQNDHVSLTRKCGIEGELVEILVELELLVELSKKEPKALNQSRLEGLESLLLQHLQLAYEYADRSINNILFSKLGQIHSNLHNWEHAYDLFDQAFQQTNTDLDLENLDFAYFENMLFEQVDVDMMVLLNLAKMFEKQSIDQDRPELLESAYQYYRLASAALERNRPQYAYQSGLQQLGQTGQINLNHYAQRIYTGVIRTGLRKEDKITDEEVLNYMERGKAVIFKNRLKMNELIKQLSIDEQEEYATVNNKLNVAWLKTKSTKDNKNEETLKVERENLLIAQKEYNDFIEKNIEANLYSDLDEEQEWLSFQLLRDEILKDSSLLITYWFDFEQRDLYILWTDKRGNQDVEIEKLPEDFELLIKTYQDFLQTEFINGEALEKSIESSHRLYQLLCKPVLSNTKDVKHLVLIPTSQLNFISFDALLSEPYIYPSVDLVKKDRALIYRRLPFLVKEYSIVYGYSPRSLITQSKLDNSYDENEKKYLDYGGFEPSYGTRDTSDYDSSIDKELYDALAENGVLKSYDIISEIRNQFPSSLETYDWKKQDATEANFRLELKKSFFNILHISGHGFLNKSYPFESKLLLTQSKERDLYDDDISVTELFGMEIQANLVVLNSCNSGTGKLQTSEGLSSISRGFSFAGCPTTIAGMWLLNMRSSKSILKRFFQELEKGISVSEALQKAKIDYLLVDENTTNYSRSPYHWAGLVTWGKDSILFPKRN